MNLTDEQKARLFDALEWDGIDNWEGFNVDGGHYERVLAEIEAEGKYKVNRKRLEPLFEIIETNIEVDYPAGREAGKRTSLTEEGQKEVIKFISENFDSRA